jgi:hypothetical protein
LPPVRGDDSASPPPPPRRPRRRPARADGEGGRRLWSAGHAIVVGLLALLFGALLNAPGIHKSAYNQPDGWKRDVALAVTNPLQAVSHALFLDRPRAAVQSAIGRSGIDDIDTDLGIEPAAGPAEPQPPAGPPAPPTKQRFTPGRPMRLWTAGDSLVIVPGYAIQRAVADNRAVKPVGELEGQIASGLTRPDVFNWFDEIRTKLRELKPNAIVLCFGANDTNSYMTGVPEGVSIGSFGTESWLQEYRRRVAGVFDLARRAGTHVVWLGLPVTDDASQSSRFGIVNAVAAEEARKRPDAVTFVDTYLLLAGPDGGYAEYLTSPGGGQVKVRSPDGIHFEPDGGDIIADKVLEALGRTYDFTSWKKGSS